MICSFHKFKRSWYYKSALEAAEIAQFTNVCHASVRTEFDGSSLLFKVRYDGTHL